MNKQLAGLLLLSSCAFAAGPTIITFGIGEKSHSTAHIWWITDVPTINNTIKYGPTTSYGSVSAPIPNNTRNHAWWVSDQPAGSTLHYSLCSTANGTETCTPDQTLTFLPDVPHPVIPALPAVVPPSNPGPVTGTTFTVSANCSDLQTKINSALAADGNLTHWVKILPDGTRAAECYTSSQITIGPKTGPNPNGAGYIIIGPDPTSLPPNGVRIDRSYLKNGKMATVISGIWNTFSYSPVPCSSGALYGGFGTLWWDTAQAGWAMKLCDAATSTWQPVQVAGSSVKSGIPSTCTEGQWWDQTDAATHEDRPWLCSTIDGVTKYRNRHVQGWGAIGDDAVLRFTSGSHHVVLRGLRMAQIPVPNAFAAGFAGNASSPGFTQIGSFYSSVVGLSRFTFGAIHDLIFDRNILEGWGYPTRHLGAFNYMDGANIAIVNNLVDTFTAWQPAANTIYSAQYSTGIQILDGPGPYLIENNNLNGITGQGAIFIGNDNSSITWPSPKDITIRRNTLKTSDSTNACDPSSDGKGYWSRHRLECKSCERVLLDGNVFDGGWRGLNTGSSISLSVRVGALHPLTITNGSINVGVYPFGGQVGDQIVIFQASNDAHNGAFTVSSISADKRTLTAAGITGNSTGGYMFKGVYNQTVSDITALNNLFTNTQVVFSNNANNDNGQSTMAASGKRWLIENNLSLFVGQKAGWGMGVPCSSVNAPAYWQTTFVSDELGGEDHVIRHNTIARSKKGNSDYLGTFCAYTDYNGSREKIEGYYCNDNIQTVTDGVVANGFWYDGSFEGDNALAHTTSRGEFRSNVIMRPPGSMSNYGSTNKAVTDNAGMGWFDHNFTFNSINDVLKLRLKDNSPFRSGAKVSSDGLQAGADIDKVAASLGVVDNVRVLSIQPDSATLSFLAPDTMGCPVDYSQDQAFNTWTRVANAGGKRAQDVPLTGLTPATTYYYRVNCAVQQPTGSFRTR